MARYVVGDIQGCFAEFSALLTRVKFDPQHDLLFSVGDIVNRGPASLEVLRWMYANKDAVHMVLGNHDLHLLMVASGYTSPRRKDTLHTILQAPDKDLLLEWLRHQPLFSVFDDFCLVHAGVWPGWHLDEVIALAREAEAVLQSANYGDFFRVMYGDKPDMWSLSLQGADRWRFIINSMTRMRALYADKKLDFAFKGLPSDLPPALCPWYTFPQQPDIPRILCGHWSATDLCLSDQVWSVDTGCVWGNRLTFVDCDSGEIFQQPAIVSH